MLLSDHTSHDATKTPEGVCFRLLQILEQIHRECPAAIDQPVVMNILECKKGLLKKVERTLDNMGFRRFKLLSYGQHAIALESTDNQIIRISDSSYESSRPKHPAILQPIDKIALPSGCVIEILPRVRTSNITQEQYRKLHNALHSSGLHVQDILKPGNVGIMVIGNQELPVLIDSGVVEGYTPFPFHGKRARDPVADWLAEDGTWLQQQFEPRKKPSNVIPTTELAAIEKRMRGKPRFFDKFLSFIEAKRYDSRRESQTVNAIAKDGLYPDQLAALYERAAERLDDEENVSFSELLRQERERLKDSQAKER